MVDVAGGGHIGFALESTHGTYIAPTNYAMVTAESLHEVRGDVWRKPIIGQAVTLGKVEGKAHVEGSLTMELLAEVFAYFLIASRWGNNVQKSGTSPYYYTATDDAAVHVKTNYRSLTIVADRAGIGFAYLGCQATSFRFFQEDGIPMVEIGIIGREQAEDYTPSSATIPGETPFAANDSVLQIAAGTRTDVDGVEISFDDNGEAVHKVTIATGAEYIKFGEHVGEASFEIDFESKADYAIWVARTAQRFSFIATKDSNTSVNIEIHGASYDVFEVDLSGIGDQVKAAATLRTAYVGVNTASATIIVKTTESITLS